MLLLFARLIGDIVRCSDLVDQDGRLQWRLCGCRRKHNAMGLLTKCKPAMHLLFHHKALEPGAAAVCKHSNIQQRLRVGYIGLTYFGPMRVIYT